MTELWSFVGALVGFVVLMILLSGAYITINAFAVEWRRAASGVLAIHLLRWRWEDGLAKTREREFWERRYLRGADIEASMTVEDWRRLTLAFMGVRSDDSMAKARLDSRTRAVQSRALRRLSEWAERQVSVDSVLRHWWWRSALERCGLTLVGWRYVGRPTFDALTEKLRDRGTPILVWAPVLALGFWGLLSNWNGSGNTRGDWISYVGWWTAAAAVLGVVVPLTGEALRMFKALNPNPPPHARKVLVAAMIVVIAMFAAQHFGAMRQLSAWIDGRVSSLPVAESSWIGGLLFAAILTWVSYRNVHILWVSGKLRWRWAYLLPTLTGLALLGTSCVAVTGHRWLSVAELHATTVVSAGAFALAGSAWGIQTAILWGRRAYLEKKVVDAVGGVDMAGFVPRLSAVALTIWVGLVVTLTLLDINAYEGWPYLGVVVGWQAVNGILLPQAILFALWRRRLRRRFELVQVRDLDTVLAEVELPGLNKAPPA